LLPAIITKFVIDSYPPGKDTNVQSYLIVSPTCPLYELNIVPTTNPDFQMDGSVIFISTI